MFLHIIGVAGTVDVSIVARLRLVLDMARFDGDNLRRVAHRTAFAISP